MKSNEKHNTGIFDFFLLVCCLVAAFLCSYIFIYKMMPLHWTDVAIHTNLAQEFLDGITPSAHPGYYLVFALFKLFGLPTFHAAASAVGLFAVLAGIAVYVICGYYLGWDQHKKVSCLIVLFMSFFGPLYLGGETYYLGQGSFNTWHNPTNSGVKFLALTCFFLFVYVFHMAKDQQAAFCGRRYSRTQLSIILSVLTCISLIFKPSFFQVFAPSLAAIFALDFLLNRRSLREYFLDALVYVPAVLVILYQMFATFGSEDSGGGMYIYFARGWSFHSDNIFRSIMTQAIFPLFVCLFCEKNIFKNKMLLYAMIFYLVGVGEGLFLVESGSRVSHGNFLWGNNLGIGIAFLACILVFAKYVEENWKKKSGKYVTCIGSGILLAQFLLGVYYILKCIMVPLEYF